MAAPVIAAQGAFVSYSGAASAAVPVPSGVVAGSVVIAHVVFAWNETTTAPTSANITPPSGWTLAYGAEFLDSADGYTVYDAWYYHTATATESGTYTFTGATVASKAALAMGGVAFRITGAATVPLGDTLQIGPIDASGTSTVPTFTPSRDNSLLIGAGTSFANIGTSPTVPTGWTSLGSASGSGAGGQLVADIAQTTAAATGALAFNLKGGDYTWVTVATVQAPQTAVNASVTATAATASVSTSAPAVSVTNPGNVTITAPPLSASGALATPAVTATSSGVPTLSGETSRTTGTTANGTAYTKVVGTLANATSGSSDGYVAYFPSAIHSNIKLLIWNHPYESPYDADIAGTGDSGWTFALTSWLLDNGIAIVSSNDAGDQFGLPPVMTAIDNLYGAINTAMGVTKLALYGESMGGAATLNWTARHNTAPLVGAMSISGVADTSQFTSYFTYNAAYNPMLTAASDWVGLPIFLGSSPQDGTVNEAQNATAFANHVAGQAVVTHVETTGDHLTSGNYPVAAMESWFNGVFTGSNPGGTATAATGSGSAPAPTVSATQVVSVTAPAITATAPNPGTSATKTASVAPSAATGAAQAANPAVSATQTGSAAVAVTAGTATGALNAPQVDAGPQSVTIGAPAATGSATARQAFVINGTPGPVVVGKGIVSVPKQERIVQVSRDRRTLCL